MRLVAIVLLAFAPVVAAQEDADVRALLVRLESREPRQRATAAKALASLGDGPVSAALRKALSDPSPDVRHAAACTLARRGEGDGGVFAVLTASARSDDWHARWEACIALGKMGGAAAAAVDLLVSLLADEDPLVSREAAIALCRIGLQDRKVVGPLVIALDQGAGDRDALLLCLVRLSRLDAVRWLAREARTDKHGFAGDARRRLRELEPCADTLVALFDTDPKRRALACDQLPKECLAYLVAAIEDREAFVRRAAIRRISVFGEGARPAAAALVRALVDPDLETRIHARLGLQKAGFVALVDAIRVSPKGEARLAHPLESIANDDETLAAVAAVLGKDVDTLRKEIAAASK
ncbi:MAG TPA: HEAT repeat domain-containing protein [Planctomycetota bacterium]|nr:HEAT repeat domain-containing protein [Planctomycetota bacterium]